MPKRRVHELTRTSIEIEKEMIDGIIQGRYQAKSRLKTERELASSFQVGRPTIREVLQRLSHRGWITLSRGRPATVNDFWKEGNVKTIVDIVEHSDEVPDTFVLYFLEMRIAITPQYVKKAVEKHHPKVVAILSRMDELKDDAEAFAVYDWELQKELAYLSENPLFLLTLNSFEDIYVKMAIKYFSLNFCRKASLNYYKELMKVALQADTKRAAKLAHAMMEKSYTLWESHMSSDGKTTGENIN